MRLLHLFDLALLGSAMATPSNEASSSSLSAVTPFRSSKTATSTKPGSLFDTTSASTPIMYWPKSGTSTQDVETQSDFGSAATVHHIVPPSHVSTSISTVTQASNISSPILPATCHPVTIRIGAHTMVGCSGPTFYGPNFSVEPPASETSSDVSKSATVHHIIPPSHVSTSISTATPAPKISSPSSSTTYHSGTTTVGPHSENRWSMSGPFPKTSTLSPKPASERSSDSSSTSIITSTVRHGFPPGKPLPSTCRYVMVGDNTRIICATEGFGRTSTTAPASDTSSDPSSTLNLTTTVLHGDASDLTTTTTTTTVHPASSHPSTATPESETMDIYGFKLVVNATLTMPDDEDEQSEPDLPSTSPDVATSTSTSTSITVITIDRHIPSILPLSKVSKAKPTHKSPSGHCHGPSLAVRATSTGTVTVVLSSATSSDFTTIVKPSETRTSTRVVTIDPSTTTSAPEDSDDEKSDDDSDDDDAENTHGNDNDKDEGDHKPDPPKPEASVIHGSHYHFLTKYDTFVVYGKNFNYHSLSPRCPADVNSPCEHKFKGKGLKKALHQNLASKKVKEWEFTDDKKCGGNAFCPDEEWDFVVVARTHGWNWIRLDDALEAAGGPKDGIDVTHSDVEQLAGCPHPSRGSRYWDKLMFYLYGGNDELSS